LFSKIKRLEKYFNITSSRVENCHRRQLKLPIASFQLDLVDFDHRSFCVDQLLFLVKKLLNESLLSLTVAIQLNGQFHHF
jgi:hypothetical protein